jgi:hypothetical protein
MIVIQLSSESMAPGDDPAWQSTNPIASAQQADALPGTETATYLLVGGL